MSEDSDKEETLDAPYEPVDDLDTSNEQEVVLDKWSSIYQDDPSKELREKSNPKLVPVHKGADSLLTNASGYDSYQGFKNLTALLLVLTNFNVFLQNILKYGVLVDHSFIWSVVETPDEWPSAGLLLASSIFIALAFSVEVLISKRFISEGVALVCHCVICFLVVAVPIGVSLSRNPHPVFFTLALAWYTILFLKLISYAMVNFWCREEWMIKKEDSEHKPAGPVVYPNNVNVKDMCYFILAPTMCYELNYPRNERIDWRFVLKRSGEGLFLLVVMIASYQQWIVKSVNNSMSAIEEGRFAEMLIRLLTLAIPNHLIWLMFFVSYFHCWLNVVAELLCFADRTFYKAWWNATTVSDFWTNWNIPIHKWCKRHLYVPLRRLKYSKNAAMIIVFLVSAFFHEYLVAVPLKLWRPYAFLGMMMQFPLVVVSARIKGQWGNVFMWCSLILGQPMAILMYYHDWLVENSKVGGVTPTV